MIDECKCGFDHWPLPCKDEDENPPVRPKTFQESARCPTCLTVGEMRFQYGNYCCDRCDECWGTDRLGHWMKAFEQGREFERQNKK